MYLPSARLRTHLLRFLGVGSVALMIDLGGFYLLSTVVPTIAAKALSFVAATQFVFACSKYWTFADAAPGHGGWQFFQFNSLYLVTLVANTAVHSVVLYVTTVPSLGALLIASTTSTTINFLVQRHYIFIAPPPPTQE